MWMVRRGKPVEAERLFGRAVAIVERALGIDHPQLVTTLNNLAALYIRNARFVEAEARLTRALNIAEGALDLRTKRLATRSRRSRCSIRARIALTKLRPRSDRRFVFARLHWVQTIPKLRRCAVISATSFSTPDGSMTRITPRPSAGCRTADLRARARTSCSEAL